MTHLRTTLVALSLVAGVALTGCSGSSEDTDDDAARGCAPGDGAALRVLADDKAALPADNWVPVLSTRDGFRDTLALLDQASLGFSPEDLQAIAATATREERDAALTQAVSDVAEGGRGAGAAGAVRLVVPEGATALAVGFYYRAALARIGARATIERADLEPALDALAGDERAATPVVLTRLSALAGAVGAERTAGADASAQVQAAAMSALERDLVLGSTAAATGAAQVLVPDALVSAKGLVTLSDLATACQGSVVAVAGDDEAAAEAVAETYGFDVGSRVDTPADAFGATGGADGDTVAVVARQG